jgi:hypothetical protein
MGEIERIIIDARGDLILQVQAAQAAIESGIEEGGLFGMGKAGKFFGVKRNKGSVRVYPQEEQR